MGAWYVVTKTIKGHRYLYRQRTWRVGSRVRTQSQYMGRSDAGGFQPALPLGPGKPRRLSEYEAVQLWLRGEMTGLRGLDLPEKFRMALTSYTGSGYDAMNKSMRGYAGPTTYLRQSILKIKKYIYSPHATLQANVTLYRSTIVRADRLKIGSDFVDNGFISYSVEKHTALKFMPTKASEYEQKVLVVLHGRKGDAGYQQVTGVTKFHHEREVISRAGRFKIVHIDVEDDVTICTVEKIEHSI